MRPIRPRHQHLCELQARLSRSHAGAGSQVGAGRHGADQAGEQGFSFRGVKVQLRGGAAEGMVGAPQPAIDPGVGLKRLGGARIAQQLLHLLD